MAQIVQLEPFLFSIELGEPGDPSVRALVILGERYTVVFDTLYAPQDMAPALALAGRRRRPVLVVNSHADYDHAWGNGAFPNAPIIGHAATRERLLREGGILKEKQHQDPARYADVHLCPPDLVFDDHMAIDVGGLTLDLHHLAGHTRDCIVGHLPEHGILFGGDCVEVPFPLLNDGPLDGWIAALRAWDDAARVRSVIPAHGPVSGRDLLARNAAYLQALLDGRGDQWQLPPATPAFYRDAHAQNVRRAAELTARN
jgi:glyoxylase-like metal-dependent hydrolase (beta-lactamase superfamily II)